MNVCCDNVDIAALIDTGSSINIMSAALYKSLPRHVKSDISRFTEPIKLANGQLIFVEGTSSVTIKTNQGLHEVKVYILSTTSHPLILGMEYLKSSNITLKFSEFNTNSKYHYVKCNKRLSIQPNSEIFVRANVPKYLSVGLQGICTNNAFSLGKGLLLAKAIPGPLNPEQTTQLTDCLYENKDIFLTKENPDLGFSTYVQHTINLKPDVKPKHQQPYRLPPHKREVLRHHLDELLKQGIIAPISEEENVPITSPIVLVTKRKRQNDTFQNEKDAALSQYRFCCDFRYLNSCTEQFKYFIPNLQELTESFSQFVPNYISSIDLSSGFFQLGIDPDSTRYTAFNTCFGTYKFLRLPMGLSSSPASFQLLMDKVLHGLKFKSCLCYLDDVLICSETFEQHITDLQEVFHRFRSAGLKLGPKKCSFAQSSCIFLGHSISKEGVSPPPDRVQAIQEYPPPKNVKRATTPYRNA
ncbi:unnamed protein product [Mytilus coruscus]|uniref:Reverse transcriptase domain-containing protein n=1 Tax=Mytilus coruscus TaxID=42192 RepID=A0A6J8A2D1_MYTCO|nr:unnamed protein product [Mytilus coruscus]